MSDSQTIKLQAWIAHQGLMSRRQAETAIAEGKVKVNGVRAHIGQRINPSTDIVSVKNKTLNSVTAEPPVYFLVNKPPGIVSTTQDELNRETVLSLVPELNRRV
jgi:16S rRNA U516 pseudouridylate synthase RsuA-like enzyme